MGLFSSSQPSIRARILPRFPAQVLAGNGMTITKSGGTYVFAVDPYADVPVIAIEDIPTDTLIGRDTAGNGPPEIISVSQGLGMTGTKVLGLTNNQRIRAIPMLITNAGTTGVKADILVPFACTITQVTLLADAVGSIVVDIWKAAYAGYPPTVANKITASAPPTISSAIKAQDNTLVGWTTSIAAGDILRYNVNSVATIARVAVCLDVVTL